MELHREYLPAIECARQQLVLLHGWGSNRDIWRPLLAGLRPWADVHLLELPGCAPGCASAARLEQVLAGLAACCPAQAVLVGWSLGGQLALELAAREPSRVAAVVTLASNPRFVAAGTWPGMDEDDFEAFQAGYAADPVAGLRRFDSLQTAGAGDPRALLRALRRHRPQPAGGELRPGLEWLAQLDQRELLRGLAVPQLHLLAESDGLVPGAALAAALGELLADNERAAVEVLPSASHVLPLEAPAAVAGRIRAFLESGGLLAGPVALPATPAKRDIAASFSRAAYQYDSVATLQRAVAGQLLERLQPAADAAPNILDLGCGTGSARPDLLRRYPRGRYIGLDLAAGMIAHARQRFEPAGLWLVGDAEALPLAAGAVDLVFSSLAFQWCYRPEKLFAELNRVLAPGGRCVFATLGPDTLHELRTAWAAVDAHQHVNRFLAVTELEAAARRVPGMQLSLQRDYHCMRYSRVGELLSELKTLGAHNMNRDRPAGLTSRRALRGMSAAYESQRAGGTLPATYEVIFGEVRKAYD